MKNVVNENLYPKWDSFSGRSMEKMLLLFADRFKGHAAIGSLEELQNYFRREKEWNSSFDWVQLHSGYLFNHVPLKSWPGSGILIDEHTNAFLDEAIALCKREGKRVSYMVGNFAPLDSLLEAYPEIRNLNNGLFWKVIYDTVCGLFERFPGLDEFAMYFFESQNILQNQNFFRCMNYGADLNEEFMKDPEKLRRYDDACYPYLSFGDHLRLMLQAAAKACKDCGKTFSLLTHVWYPYQEELLYEALKDFPSDLPILLEHNYTTGDFNMALPFPELTRRLPHLNHGICFCCGMEYHGLSLVPCCYPESLEAIIHAAMEATPNLKRITVRPMWDGQSLLNTPNEINLFTVMKLADHPDSDPEQLWREWLKLRYNLTGEAADQMVDLLKRSYPVVQNVFFEFGIRTNNHSHLPDFGHLESRLHNYGKALIRWNPTPDNLQTVYDLLIRPGQKILRQHRCIHQEALYQIKESLKSLEKLENSLQAADYEDIRLRFLRLDTWVLFHQYEYEAYIRLLIQRKGEDSSENLAAAESALEKLTALTKEIRTGVRSDCYLFSLKDVDSFTEKCRKELQLTERE